MKMKAPLNSGGASHPAHGEVAVGETGVVDVPAHIVDDLRSHGFMDHVESVSSDDQSALAEGDEFDKMDRASLLALLEERGKPMFKGAKMEVLRAAARELPPEQLKTPPAPPPAPPQVEPPVAADAFDAMTAEQLVAYAAPRGKDVSALAIGEMRAMCRNLLLAQPAAP